MKTARVLASAVLAISPLIGATPIFGTTPAAADTGTSPSPTATVGTGNGQAAPQASLAAACGSGVTVVLSNLNGDVPVTFTVTRPDGSQDTVTVAADKIVRRTYPVANGVTTPVTVSAPGMATVSRGLPATCSAAATTKVLGIKVVRKPTAGARARSSTGQLPFTGPHFPAEPALILGIGLLLGGAGLTRIGSRPTR
jgi:hypothetical protein